MSRNQIYDACFPKHNVRLTCEYGKPNSSWTGNTPDTSEPGASFRDAGDPTPELEEQSKPTDNTPNNAD